MNRLPSVDESLHHLRAAAALPGERIILMEVCGSHTMAACRSGINSLLPQSVTLLSGPGCPVCVTAQGDIDLIVALAARPDVTLCTYGDMVRVPGSTGSLELARGKGADVRVIYSAMDAVKLAVAEPGRQYVLAGVGFETTAPATAACVAEAQRRGLKNFSVLSCHKRALPAVGALLASGTVPVDGLICPGHVAVITGSAAFEPIVRDYHKPCAITGFQDAQMLAALAWLAQCVRRGQAELANLYPEAVTANGNPVARQLMDRVFETRPAVWRGLGTIPNSGLFLRPEYSSFDAATRFGLLAQDVPEPAGCRCGQVITGRCTPADCGLFARACTPLSPVGPCMVSSEGTCQAWFKYRRAADVPGVSHA